MSKLKSYVGTKIINAEPMSRFDYLSKIQDQEIPTGEDEPGYLVVYPPDNYRSWSPEDVFERCYRQISEEEKKIII